MNIWVTVCRRLLILALVSSSHSLACSSFTLLCSLSPFSFPCCMPLPSSLQSDAFGSSSSTGSLRSKFTNRSTPCLRHFLDPTEDDDNGANRDDHSRKGRKKNSAFPAGECNGEGNSHCAVATYCRMLRASTEGLGANLWTVRLLLWRLPLLLTTLFLL